MGNVFGTEDKLDLDKDAYVPKTVMWSMLDEFQQIEHQMPFYTMDLDVYEARLK